MDEYRLKATYECKYGGLTKRELLKIGFSSIEECKEWLDCNKTKEMPVNAYMICTFKLTHYLIYKITECMVEDVYLK